MLTERDSKIQLLETIASAWNGAGINYAVAHGLERYPSTVGRDLDILVAQGDVDTAIEIAGSILNRHGLAVTLPPPLWGHRIVAVGDGGLADAIEIHTMPRLSWRNVTLVASPESSTAKGPFKVDPWTSVAKRILMPLLAGEVERFVRKPEELSIVESERELMALRLGRLGGQELAGKVCAAVDRKDLQALRFLLPQLRISLSLRAIVHGPLMSIGAAWHSIRRKFGQFFAPCAPVIALVGPDGVGKSTILNMIANGDAGIFTKIVVRHWRPGILPSLNTFVRLPVIESKEISTLPRRNSGSFQWLRICYYSCDFILGHILKNRIDASHQRLVLYDRCALDMVVDPVRYGLSSRRGARFLWWLTPKPDKVVLLYDHPNRIYERKAELPVEEIHRQLQTWLGLAAREELDAIVPVDAPPDQIAERVKGLIMEAFSQQNGGGKPPTNLGGQWLPSIPSSQHQDLVPFRGELKLPHESSQENNGQEFGAFRIKDGRQYLLPLSTKKGAVEALNLYNAQTFLAKSAKRLLALGLQLGLAQHYLPKVHFYRNGAPSQHGLLDWYLLEHFRQILSRQDLQFGVSLGTPGPHRKPVLQALTPNGETLGYIKVGWNEKTNTLVQNEAQILRHLGNTSCSSFTTPMILHEGWWKDSFFCIQSPPVGSVEVPQQRMTPQYLAAQNELMALHTCWIPLRKSRLWADFSQRTSIVQNAYYRYVLQRGADTVAACLGDTPLPFHLSHGDFAPWNMRMLDGRLLLFDWEYATMDALPAYDLFHFTIQTARLLHKWPPGQTCQAIQCTDPTGRSIAGHLDQLGLRGIQVKPLLLLYVLERLAFYVSEHDSDRDAVQFFARMANILILKEPSIP